MSWSPRFIPTLLHKCDFFFLPLTTMGPWDPVPSSLLFSTVFLKMGSCPTWSPGEGPEEPRSPHWLTYDDKGLF